VGVPDSTLVLGKHSGRHALRLRCEQLGFEFDRRELDEVYRQFVVLADRVKHVRDHDLLGLIEAHRSSSRRIPPAHVEALPVAIGAGAGKFATASLRAVPISLPENPESISVPRNLIADHHSEQEDYLWGV
jgi:2-isopropylmalate synthase